MSDEKTCRMCGKAFVTKNPRRIYCSRECKVEHNKLSNRRRYHEDAAYRERVHENRRRWGEEHGENMGSWCSVERTELYAKRAVAALDEESRELLGLLLKCDGHYSRKMLLCWCERPSLGGILREIKRSEDG